LIIDGVECDFNFIICSDIKSLLMFSGINSVCGKHCCIYCRSHKSSYSEVESFFLENEARSHLEGGLGTDSTDWFHIKRSLYGIKNDILITIDIFDYRYITFFCHIFFD
jgi:hypothetical protein